MHYINIILATKWSLKSFKGIYSTFLLRYWNLMTTLHAL
jgi:hypothetical protein